MEIVEEVGEVSLNPVTTLEPVQTEVATITPVQTMKQSGPPATVGGTSTITPVTTLNPIGMKTSTLTPVSKVMEAVEEVNDEENE